MSDQEQQHQKVAAAEETSEQQEQQQQEEETKPTGPQKPSQEQRLFQAKALGNLVNQTVISNLPANQRPIPEWKRKKLEQDAKALGNLVNQTVISNLPANQRPIPEWKRKKLEQDAIARGETIAATENDGQRPDVNAGDGVYKPPHQRLPPTPLVSQQAQERSAFPGDFWFHKEIENLISQNRTKVQAGREGEEDPFWDRSGKSGKGVISSYHIQAWPIIRNAVRGRRGYFDDENNNADQLPQPAEGTNDFGRITQTDNNHTAANAVATVLSEQQQEELDEKRLGSVPVPTLYSDDDEEEN